jgi:hypothetical protein
MRKVATLSLVQDQRAIPGVDEQLDYAINVVSSLEVKEQSWTTTLSSSEYEPQYRADRIRVFITLLSLVC